MDLACMLEKIVKYCYWILSENKDITTPTWLRRRVFIIDPRESSARSIWKGPD